MIFKMIKNSIFNSKKNVRLTGCRDLCYYLDSSGVSASGSKPEDCGFELRGGHSYFGVPFLVYFESVLAYFGEFFSIF